MKALLLGYYGARNLGDDMMLYCLLRWLNQQAIQVTVVSEDPKETERRFSVSVIRNAPLLGEWACWESWLGGHALRLVRAIWASDVLIVGGGELIRDDVGWKTFWYTMEKIVAALLLRKRLVLVSIGLVEPRTVWARRTLRHVLRRCSRVIVRDERSYRVCLNLGAGDVLVLKPDIALSLPSLLVETDRELVRDEAPYVVVSLRKNPNDFGSYPYGDPEIDALARALDEVAASTGTRVVFVPFQIDAQDGDNLIHRKITCRMQQKDMVQVEDWTSDLEVLSKRFRGASCVVAMRLHAAVLGVAHRRPVIVMPYDQKVAEFADLVGITARIDAGRAADADYMKRLVLMEMRATEVEYAFAATQDWESIRLREESHTGESELAR